MRRLLTLPLALALIAPLTASAQHAHGPAPSGPVVPARLTFDTVVPEHLDIVSGDTVRWVNDSVRAHTVTADDESFDSGRLNVGGVFTRRFEAPAVVPYHCVLHPAVNGVVAVHPILLNKPSQAGAPGRTYPLAGRAALAAGTPVTIEADHGQGFAPVTTTNVEADGHFSATVVPRTTTTLRAVAEGGAISPTVPLVVLDRRVGLSAQAGRRRHLIRTTVAPAAPGSHVVLQLYLRERFGWWPVQRGRLDSRSRARFSLRTRRRVAARVVLTLPDGATPLAVSRTLRLGPRF